VPKKPSLAPSVPESAPTPATGPHVAPGGLQVHRLPLADLHLDPLNARSHPEENLAAVRASLGRWGQVEPLVVRASDKRVVGGNARLTAMNQLGWKECDVVLLDLDDRDAAALGIALNRAAELATWDEPVLAKTLAELRADGDLIGVGFEPLEIEHRLGKLGLDADGHPIPEVVDAGEQEIEETGVSRRGEIWHLGGHRIMNGDSTSKEDVERLVGQERGALLATDPPYLVDYKGGNHPQSWANKPETRDKHWDDYVDPTEGLEFFSAWLSAWLSACVERVPVYQWHATRRQVIVEEAWKQNGLLVHQTLIWVKARPVLTRCHFMWQHEPCFYGWREGFMPEKERKPPSNEKTVWQIDQVGQQDGIHQTQKPLEIFLRPIKWHTLPGEAVFEPFSGSGTQLIAAEQLGRRCFAMEISPNFVDAAIRRWQATTGRQATLGPDGPTWDQVKAERLGSVPAAEPAPASA